MRAELAAALDATLDAGQLPDLAALQRRFEATAADTPAVTVTLPTAATYDTLLANAEAAR